MSWLLFLRSAVAKLGLGIYTCGPWLGLACASSQEEIRTQQWLEGRQLSEALLPHLAAFLGETTWSDLAWIAVVSGPGSFTSLRLGMVLARTLGQTLQIPVFTRSALFCAAGCAIERPLAVSMLAHGEKVYGALFEEGAEQLWTTAEWQGLAKDLPQLRVEDLAATDLVNALCTWARAAYERGERPTWREALPHYLQAFPHS